MAETASCPSCKNKLTIPCLGCSGRGVVGPSPYPPYLGKLYTCIDCTGSGEIPCPRCNPNERNDVRVRAARPSFGHI